MDGFVIAFHDGGDGAFTQAAYFSSEEEARRAEREEPPPEAMEPLRDADALMPDLRYYDLRDPWLYSPR